MYLIQMVSGNESVCVVVQTLGAVKDNLIKMYKNTFSHNENIERRKFNRLLNKINKLNTIDQFMDEMYIFNSRNRVSEPAFFIRK